MDNHTNLIKIYLLVCENWDNNLKYVSARHSNNANPEFTDQAIITIMTYCAAYEKRFGIIEAYCFTNTYLRSWFPKLPSYVAFNTRANRNADTFRAFTQLLISYLEPAACSKIMQVVDSLPIITCSGKRTPKVATEIVSKGYCPSKSLFYHGVKLHTLGSVIEGTLPFPRSIFVSSASESDLNVFRDNWSLIRNMVTFADKAYIDSAMQTQMASVDYEILTPVKHPKGTCDVIKQMFASADNLYSAAVSRVRQPIESWFNWLIQKTDIQRASKIHSTNGLIVHIFNKINAALCNRFL